MSVVLVNTQGCVLDARSLIDKGYLQCIRVRENNQKSHVNCRFKGQCFQILKSHLDAIASVAADGGNIETLQKTDKPTKVNQGLKHLYSDNCWLPTDLQSPT